MEQVNNSNIEISVNKKAHSLGLGDGTVSSDQVLLIWRFTQALTSPELFERKDGFQRLIELNIINKSPLITYILATRINEVDITLRAYIVNVLANILEQNIRGDENIELTKLTLVDYLSQIGKREIHALIQLVEVDPFANENIVKIMCSSSCAGDYLNKIASDRQATLNIRQLAITLLGEIGYLDAIPDLERLENRIKSRDNPNSIGSEEKQLLPQIADALALLRAP
jgi:hypothetical protein